MDWATMSEEDKMSFLIDGLNCMAVQTVNPEAAEFYLFQKPNIPDKVDRMRYDVDVWFPLVYRLRNSGLIPTREETIETARSMLELSAEEVYPALSRFASELKKKQEKMK